MGRGGQCRSPAGKCRNKPYKKLWRTSHTNVFCGMRHYPLMKEQMSKLEASEMCLMRMATGLRIMGYECRDVKEEPRMTRMSQLGILREPDCTEWGCSIIVSVSYLTADRLACSVW